MSSLLRRPDYEVYPSAQRSLHEFVDDFAGELLLEAQNVAKRERAGVVTDKHVQIAYDRVSLNCRSKRSRDVAKIVGGALFGAFPGGFATALGVGDEVQVVFYTVLGIVGLALIFWGFLDG